MEQTKVNIELKLSRNFNTVSLGIQDEPINSETEEKFKKELKEKCRVLREVIQDELRLINSLPSAVEN